MLTSDPQEQFKELKTQLLEQISSTFPIKSRKGGFEVRVRDLRVDDSLGVDDVKSQARARMEGRSWAAPVKGTIEVVDTKTGEVLVSRERQIAKLPKLTRHFSYIVAGQEKFVANQWRLRPGIYVRATQKPGEHKAQFQLAKGRPFNVQQDPNGGLFMTISGSSRKIPAYSVLSALGMSDEKLKKAWGEETLAASRAKAKSDKDLRSFYRAWAKGELPKGEDPLTAVRGLLAETKMDPVVAEANLGVRKDSVDGDVLLRATRKLVDVSAGRKEPDPIDSLRYKELWTATDHFVDRLRKANADIERRVQNTLGKKSVREALLAKNSNVLRDVFAPDLVQRPLFHVFSTSLATNGKQTNPLSMLSDRSLVTIKGPGGVTNPHQIKKPNQVLDPSHLGFLDPVFTPEGEPGVNTHLTFGLKIKDRKPYIRLYNTKTKRLEDVDAAEAAASNVVLPDQVKWKGGKPTPSGKTVRMSNRRGAMVDAEFSKADYVLPSPTQVFATETNLVPFMQNDSAGRSSMSARHMAQAISIVGREPPAVQVEAGAGKTFEEIVGDNFLAHKAPVDGTVKEVKKDEVIVADKNGKLHSVHIYDHYPTNDPKGQLHSTPTVKPGQRVKAGQHLAENNYSKDGKLALGTNLRVAYLANGANHEDGIVISEKAAEKLSSEHLYKPSMLVGKEMKVGKRAFMVAKQGAYSKERLRKIGDDGVIKVGQTVEPGDPLVLALDEVQKANSINAKTQKKIGRRLRTRHNNASMTWSGKYSGEVVRVVRSGKNVVVHVKTKEPAQVGSKLSTRHSAKGIVTEIRDDKDMPKDAAGKPVQMLINPVSVPGRMNPGQILETTAGKIAEKTGQPYKVKNFQGGVDYLKKVRADLKKHGVKETETLFDPKTGRKLGDITVGPHYVFQLEHQIDKKTSVRGGAARMIPGVDMPKVVYDADTRVPRGGGYTGAQTMDSLGIYGALASGLTNNLREMQTLKSDMDQAQEVWGALTNGERLPTPEVPFAFDKFRHLMEGLGVDMRKEGTRYRLIPRTDDEIRAISHGEIKRPTMTVRVKGEGEKPDKHGLFGKSTGGPAGTKWTHIELQEPMPNPVFSKAIALTLGLDARNPGRSLRKIIAGEEKLQGKHIGGVGIKEALSKVDLDKEMKRVKSKMDDPKTKGSALDKLNFQYKALKAVKESGKPLAEAWTMSAVPVLPPVYRPMITLRDGTIKNNPLNQLYRRLGAVNEVLRKGKEGNTRGEGKVPWDATLDSRAGLFDELQNLLGTTPKGKKAGELDHRGTKEDPNKKLPGIIHMLSGDSPKDGFFQKKLVGKRQDYTARATIVADPNLSADEIGVPKKVALELFRPMVAKRLIRAHGDPIKAHKQISEKHSTAIKALESEIENRPVIMKRDPALHQYSLVGQKVKLTESKAIKVSPLVLPPIGGDIDGDTVALFVPLSQESVEEVRRITPSQRTLSDSSGDVLFKPANESALALYRMSIPRGNKVGLRFKNRTEAEAAFKSNRIDLNDVVTIGNVKTTLGRARIAKVVPEKYRRQILTDLKRPFDRGLQAKVLKETARQQPKDFLGVADGLSRLGFQMAYESGHSVTLDDLEPLRKTRDQIIAKAKKDVDKLKGPDKDEKATQRWLGATRELHDAYSGHYDKHPTNVSDMRASGIKAKREQFQGLLMAPMLTQDPFGTPSKVPITKSFAEGIDLGGYFMQAAGARGGQIDKTQSVREPGYMSKLLVQTNIDQDISGPDCGTEQGTLMPISERDVVDRYLAKPVKLGTRTVPAGTAVTPDLLTAAKKAKVDKILVRSPLKCRMPHGVCSRCMGVHPSGKEYAQGERVGVISAQALGERAAQLMLKQTHAGGIMSTEEKYLDSFTTVNRHFSASKPNLTDAAVAPASSKITKVNRLRDGRYEIYLSGRRRPLYTRQKPLPHVRVGYQAKRGEKLTSGQANIHSIVATQGLDAMQNEMAKRIGDIYAKEGVLRRHAELAVRSATGVVKVDDPGDHDAILRGDHLMKPVVDEINRTVLKGKRPIVAKPPESLVPAAQNPLRRVTDWMARLQGERLGESIRRGVQHGESSDLAGRHPIPGLAAGSHFGVPHPRVKKRHGANS